MIKEIKYPSQKKYNYDFPTLNGMVDLDKD